MGEQENRSLDLLGIKPIADSIHTVTQAVVDGAAAFLSRMCLPAAEEFGLLLRDRVSHWRAVNAAKIATKAELIVNGLPDSDKRHAHPRLVAQIIEQGSWAESDEVQKMWAGLLASSCTVDGSDDSNLIFVDLLARLTLVEARILERACKESKKEVTQAGWLFPQHYSMSLEQLHECSGITDFHRLDRELDHLRTIGLIDGGFSPLSTEADVTPSALALQMYARCNGWASDPLEFFGLSIPSNSDEEPAA